MLIEFKQPQNQQSVLINPMHVSVAKHYQEGQTIITTNMEVVIVEGEADTVLQIIKIGLETARRDAFIEKFCIERFQFGDDITVSFDILIKAANSFYDTIYKH